MLNALRRTFFLKALQQALNTNRRQRRVHTLVTAHSIGILFDATTEKKRQEVADLNKKWQKEGKKVTILGFYNDKKAPAQEPDFPWFFQKETTWTGLPKSEKATAFANEKLDLLLVLNPDELPTLRFVAARSVAAIKIGYAAATPHDLDVQLDAPVEKGLPYFIEHLTKYLNTLVINKNAPTKTT
jgi:hypothetical protein